MEYLDKFMQKAEQFVNWLDGVPSVPAAIGGLLVGLVVPKTIVFLAIVVAVVYGVIKFNSTRD